MKKKFYSDQQKRTTSKLQNPKIKMLFISLIVGSLASLKPAPGHTSLPPQSVSSGTHITQYFRLGYHIKIEGTKYKKQIQSQRLFETSDSQSIRLWTFSFRSLTHCPTVRMATTADKVRLMDRPCPLFKCISYLVSTLTMLSAFLD